MINDILCEKSIGNRNVSKKCLFIVYSYHHNNTHKVAEQFSKVLGSKIVTPQHIVLEELDEYDLLGFGAGIDSGKHYKPLLDLADNLPEGNRKKVFFPQVRCKELKKFPKIILH